MDLGLKDKRALVAGSSAGLGFACARSLFNEGARVAICSRDKNRIEAAAASLSEDRSRVLPLTCDLTREPEIINLVENTIRSFGGIDIVVANCGGPPPGKHDLITEKEWELAWNMTFMSAVRLVYAVLPGMKENGSGRIILITSVAAKQPVDNLLLSNSYRAGLLGFAKTMSQELGPFGITVNAVLPGYTKTERLESLAENISSQTGKSKADVYNDWIQSVPVGRLGIPEEFGQFVAYLASTQAAYISGTATAVDGGQIAGII